MFMQGYYSMLRWQKEKYSLVSGIRSSINNVFGQFNESLLTNSFDDINTTNQSLNGSIHFSYYNEKQNIVAMQGLEPQTSMIWVKSLLKIFLLLYLMVIPEYAYNGTIGIIKSLKLSGWGNINIRLTGFEYNNDNKNYYP